MKTFFLISLLLCNFDFLFPNSYFSISSGELTTKEIWSSSGHRETACNCRPDAACPVNLNKKDSIYIADNITVSCHFNLAGFGYIVVENKGTLNILQGATVSGTILIENGGTMYVNGNLTMKLDGNIIDNGELHVSDSIYFQGNAASICGTGLASADAVSGNNICAMSFTILPVELLYFRGQYNGIGINLEWATASETNNDYFAVERSDDGINFSHLGTVKGVGNSKVNTNYTYTDDILLPGIFYYRLKQVDYDGKHSRSKIISVHLQPSHAAFLYPNPLKSGEKVFIELASLEQKNNISIRIFNLEGNCISYSTNPLVYDGLKICIDPGEIQPGIYSIIIQSPGKILTEKFVVMK